ncbi:MAG TPA: glycosyltransferase family 4 protein [Fimbriiglobus sp.]|jgi:glycosyltransferase involved in cell wall biosynthesis
MRIAFITAGAAGMYCGSCLRDNALVTALRNRGHDALLIPTYTPLTLDEPEAAHSNVFLGGVNVYLQEKSRLFRHTPRFFDKLFDAPRLLRWAGRFATRTDYSKLGGLTVSMLEGSHGHQVKEVKRLAAWLRAEVRPEVILLTNVLLSGIVPTLTETLRVPIVATLQGDDVFLDQLPKRDRERCLKLIRSNCELLYGLIATSRYYADHMAGYLGIDRHRIDVIPPGINLAGHGGPKPPRTDDRPVIGYFARITPEKGLHNLVDAFIYLRKMPGAPSAKLRASGWLGEQHKPYLSEQVRKLEAAGLAGDFEYVDSPGHADKVRFLNSIDVLSVPTDYKEPKGLYVFEAWANGVSVVLPEHGCFPELMEGTGAGVRVKPGNPAALAEGLHPILLDADMRTRMGEAGRLAVAERFTADAMARATEEYLSNILTKTLSVA